MRPNRQTLLLARVVPLFLALGLLARGSAEEPPAPTLDQAIETATRQKTDQTALLDKADRLILALPKKDTYKNADEATVRQLSDAIKALSDAKADELYTQITAVIKPREGALDQAICGLNKTINATEAELKPSEGRGEKPAGSGGMGNGGGGKAPAKGGAPNGAGAAGKGAAPQQPPAGAKAAPAVGSNSLGERRKKAEEAVRELIARLREEGKTAGPTAEQELKKLVEQLTGQTRTGILPTIKSFLRQVNDATKPLGDAIRGFVQQILGTPPPQAPARQQPRTSRDVSGEPQALAAAGGACTMLPAEPVPDAAAEEETEPAAGDARKEKLEQAKKLRGELVILNKKLRELLVEKPEETASCPEAPKGDPKKETKAETKPAQPGTNPMPANAAPATPAAPEPKPGRLGKALIGLLEATAAVTAKAQERLEKTDLLKVQGKEAAAVRPVLIAALPGYPDTDKTVRAQIAAAGQLPAYTDDVWKTLIGTEGEATRKSLKEAVAKLGKDRGTVVNGFPDLLLKLRTGAEATLEPVSRLTARLRASFLQYADDPSSENRKGRDQLLIVETPESLREAQKQVADLRIIEERWQPVAQYLQGTDASVVKAADEALKDLRAAREILVGTTFLLGDVIGGDKEQFVEEQVRLFYFSNVPRLMRALNPDTYLLNPEGARDQVRADELKRALREKESQLFERVGQASDQQTRLLTLDAEIAGARQKFKGAASLLADAVSGQDTLLKRRDKAQEAYKAVEADTTVPQATKDLLKQDLDQAEAELKAQNEIVAQFTTAHTSAKSQLDQLTIAQGSTPSQLKAATDRLSELQTQVRELRRQLALDAVEEAEAFGTARDNMPFYFSPAYAASTDPVRRVMMYAFSDSKTLFLRGRPEDVERVLEIVSGFDRPAPQARVTLWSLQMNGRDTKRINESLAVVDSELRDLRSRLTLVQDLLRNTLNREVKRVAEVAYKASRYSGDASRAEYGDRVARYFFYSREVRSRLGFEYELPKVPANLAAAYYDLILARDYYAAAQRELQAMIQSKPGDRQKRQVARDQFLRDAAAQMETAEIPLFRIERFPTQYALRAHDAQFQAVVNQVRSRTESLSGSLRSGAAIDPFCSSLGVNPSNGVLSGSSQITDLKWLIDRLDEDLQDVYAKNPGFRGQLAQRQTLSDAEFVTRWTLPDPAHATTMGELMFVLSLGEQRSRERVLRDFVQRAASLVPPEEDKGDLNAFVRDLEHLVLGRSRRGSASSGLYPSFPRTLLGAIESRVRGESREEGVNSNQLEILLAIEARAKEAAASEAKFLIRQVGHLYGQRGAQPFYADPPIGPIEAEKLRQQYLPLIGWLNTGFRNGGPAPDPLTQSWMQRGEAAVRSNGMLSDAIQGRRMDHLAWSIADLVGQRNSLARATPRVAAADDLIKRMMVVAENDLDHYFVAPALDRVRNAAMKTGMELGTVQRTSMLATNRTLARVDPNAIADLEIDSQENFLQSATQLAGIIQQVQAGTAAARSNAAKKAGQDNRSASGGAVAGTVAKLAGASVSKALGIAGLATLFGSLQEDPQEPRGEIYGINSGNTFKITPIFDPSGQALRFQFDYAGVTRVREPDGTRNRGIPRVERHTVNTEVQLTNLEVREISRFEANAELGIPERRFGGIPFIRNLPVLRDIPILGYYSRQKGRDGVRQESIMLGQTVMYPSVAELVDLLVDVPPHRGLERDLPQYLRIDAPPSQGDRKVLPDLSGLSFIDGERFLAVHDAKEPGRPRVSVVLEPSTPGAALGHPLRVEGVSEEPNDLESLARIPPAPGKEKDAPSFFLVESGALNRLRRIFHASYQAGDSIQLTHVADLPRTVQNIEGTAAYRIGEQVYLLFAERGEGAPATTLTWAEVKLGMPPAELQPIAPPLPYVAPGINGPKARHISALEIDSRGWVYASSSSDVGDSGPFRSEVWRIGKVSDMAGKPSLVLSPKPLHVATVDGLKVESIAVRELPNGKRELFVGTDDENYGGVLRLIGDLPAD